MIRWERQQDGNWLGLSGELLVATVAKDAAEKEQWLWTITALKRPKGWRRKGAGHRSSWIDARRAAEEPDVMRLASRSVVKERQRKFPAAQERRELNALERNPRVIQRTAGVGR